MIASMTIETPLQAIRSTYSDLDSWQERAGRMPEQPACGSRLAVDDSVFSWHPISEAARLSLITSGEHLRLARTALEARQVYPSAHFTVLRGALVGASQAVWILAAEDAAERQERGLTLIDEMYQQLQKYYGEMSTTNLSDGERLDLQSQIRWCKERLQQVAAVRRSSKKLIQTDIIKWALYHRFPDDQRRDAGRLLWRQMSADAHVLGWSMFQRGNVLTSDRHSALGLGESSRDLSQLAEPFVAIHCLLKEGWSLFERLCEPSAA
jgi:hypothetical protein